MNNGAVIAFVFVAMVLSFIPAIVYFAGERRRVNLLRSWASWRGFTFSERDFSWRFVDLGYPGVFGRVQNVVNGVIDGHRFTVYERRWQIAANKSMRAQYMVFWVVYLPQALPEVVVEREWVVPSMARGVTSPEIDFESEDFNRAYNVVGDRKVAYDVLHPRMMSWLMQQGAPGFVLRGPYLALSMPGMVTPEMVEFPVRYLVAALAQFPARVWSAPGR